MERRVFGAEDTFIRVILVKFPQSHIYLDNTNMKIIKYTLVRNMLHNSKSNENHVLNENIKFNWL